MNNKINNKIKIICTEKCTLIKIRGKALLNFIKNKNCLMHNG